jgi:hypothetical protein
MARLQRRADRIRVRPWDLLMLPLTVRSAAL